MGSVEQIYEDTVNVSMQGAFAVIRTERFRDAKTPQYSNVNCGKCKEWWVMACIEKDRKKVTCPWCGKKNKIKV